MVLMSLSSSSIKLTRHTDTAIIGCMANGISNTNPRRGSLAILEIGSLTGESAQAWTEYFGPNTYVDMITYGGKGDNMKYKNPTIECKRDKTGEEEANNRPCGRIHTFYCVTSQMPRNLKRKSLPNDQS